MNAESAEANSFNAEGAEAQRRPKDEGNYSVAFELLCVLCAESGFTPEQRNLNEVFVAFAKSLRDLTRAAVFRQAAWPPLVAPVFVHLGLAAPRRYRQAGGIQL